MKSSLERGLQKASFALRANTVFSRVPSFWTSPEAAAPRSALSKIPTRKNTRFRSQLQKLLFCHTRFEAAKNETRIKVFLHCIV
jgi:rubredoxin